MGSTFFALNWRSVRTHAFVLFTDVKAVGLRFKMILAAARLATVGTVAFAKTRGDPVVTVAPIYFANGPLRNVAL